MIFNKPYLLLLVLLLSACTQSKKIVDVTPEQTQTESVASTDTDTDIVSKLNALPGVSVKKITLDHQNIHFTEAFELMIEQPVDHNDASKGSFNQKVYLSHSTETAPMVMYLSGYGASNNRYVTEPTVMFKANQIHVEHRYFNGSIPENPNWDYLTIEQSAADHHHIVELLKTIYAGPWLNTGISKGGQTTMYHRKFYPEDVEASVVYVAPLNLALEDERIYTFLDTVGGQECQKKMLTYQLELLMNRATAIPIFAQMSKDRGYVYDASVEAAFELSIFEYGFAFFQWNGNCNDLVTTGTTVKQKVEELFKIDAPGFFTSESNKSLYPFFHQSYVQMGMYGYQVDRFKGMTVEYPENFSNYRTFISEDINLTYDGSTHQEVKTWLDANGNDMMYIVGGLDPWSATSYTPSASTNAKKYKIVRGNHGSRIKDLPEGERSEIHFLLHEWMGIAP